MNAEKNEMQEASVNLAGRAYRVHTDGLSNAAAAVALLDLSRRIDGTPDEETCLAAFAAFGEAYVHARLGAEAWGEIFRDNPSPSAADIRDVLTAILEVTADHGNP